MDLFLVFLIAGIAVLFSISVWAIDKIVTYRQNKRDREQKELQDLVYRKFRR